MLHGSKKLFPRYSKPWSLVQGVKILQRNCSHIQYTVYRIREAYFMSQNSKLYVLFDHDYFSPIRCTHWQYKSSCDDRLTELVAISLSRNEVGVINCFSVVAHDNTTASSQVKTPELAHWLFRAFVSAGLPTADWADGLRIHRLIKFFPFHRTQKIFGWCYTENLSF